MSPQIMRCGIGGLLMILVMVVFVANWSRWQRLGLPGVKVGYRPIYMKTESTNEAPKLVATNSVLLPEKVLNYTSQPIPMDPMVWGVLPKDTEFGQRYYEAPDGFGIQHMVVLMGADRTSIHKPEFCLDGGGWSFFGDEILAIPMERPVKYELPVRKLLVRAERKDPVTGKMVQVEGVYLFWFVSGDKLTAKHNDRMLWMAKDLLTRGELQRWAYVIAFAICSPGQTEATFNRMERFVRASVPEFQLVPGSGLSETAAR